MRGLFHVRKREIEESFVQQSELNIFFLLEEVLQGGLIMYFKLRFYIVFARLKKICY